MTPAASSCVYFFFLREDEKKGGVFSCCFFIKEKRRPAPIFDLSTKKKLSVFLTVNGVDGGLRLEADFDGVEGVPDERDGDAA